MTRRQAIGLSPFVALGLLLLVKPLEPYSWGHWLTGRCEWVEGPARLLLGAEEVDLPAYLAAERCWVRHGAHAPGPLPEISMMLTKFPAPAEVAAWDGEAK
jgi:hypothetical protein